jgi:hypothetical protein
MAVILDLWQPESPAIEHLENVELAVSFAATLLTDLCRQGGCGVHLALSNPGPECQFGPASLALLQGWMERLATVEAPSRDAIPELLMHSLPQISMGTEIVLIGTRPNDLADSSRFAVLTTNPVMRDSIRRIRCIDTSSPGLSAFYQPQ